MIGTFVVTALLLLSQPVLAEAPAIQERRNTEDAIQHFARCIIRLQQNSSLDRFLRTDPFMDDATDLGNKIASPACVSYDLQSMTFRPLLLRAAIYEMLYKRDFRRIDLLVAQRLRVSPISPATLSAGA